MSLVQTAELSSRHRSAAAYCLEFGRALAASFAAHWLYFAITGLFGAASMLLVFNAPGAHLGSFQQMLKLFLVANVPAMIVSSIVGLLVFHFIRIATRLRPDRPAASLYRAVKADAVDARRYLNGLPMFFAMFAFMCIFSLVKANIPAVVPFSWDETFMKLDHWLHFGNHPWQLLQPLIGNPIVTFVLAKLYSIWFIVMWLVWMWLAFDIRLTRLRTRFFVAFLLTWMIGGGLLATVFSSAGPVYYGALGLTPDPFAGLMGYLREVNESFVIEALFLQDALWQAYIGKTSAIAGISAMPSMHNATALLFVLAVWPASRRLGIALAVFAFAIFIGSVHLGWHYAVDAYLGYAVTLLCWWFAGWIARWQDALPVSRRYERLLQSGDWQRQADHSTPHTVPDRAAP